MAQLTIVFADLTGSTRIYETLGNAQATELVTSTTQWIGKLAQARRGRVIKYLGDGVLLAFEDNAAAASVVSEMQRLHVERTSSWSPVMKSMKIKIGLARGEVVEQEGDCFGDAVNVAARLSDLAGADQILATQSVIELLPVDFDIRYRNLGAMSLRGKSEPSMVYRIDWQREVSSEFLTMQASLDAIEGSTATLPLSLELSWLDLHGTFMAADMPMYLGRGGEAKFIVNNQTVSRLHASIEQRGDAFVLTDVSSYGTWVRFSGSDSAIALRRQECVLLSKGEIALGAPFDDFSVPTVSFRINAPTNYTTGYTSLL
jgi:class 3 adenylate cyclase